MNVDKETMKWFNWHKHRYVSIIRIEPIDKFTVQIEDEDGDWYNIRKADIKKL